MEFALRVELNANDADKVTSLYNLSVVGPAYFVFKLGLIYICRLFMFEL